MFIRNLISQLISTYEIDFGSFIKSRTEEATTIRYAVITAMCDYFTDIEISKSTELCRSAVNKIRNHHRYENEIEKVFETIAVLFGNESGAIDTDVIANDLLNLINIPARSTKIAGFNVTFGENEISVEMPKNILTQLIGIGKVKINQDDINKFLEMIKIKHR